MGNELFPFGTCGAAHHKPERRQIPRHSVLASAFE